MKTYHQLFLTTAKETGIPVKKLYDLIFYLRSQEDEEISKIIQKTGIAKNILEKVQISLGSILNHSAGKIRLGIAYNELISSKNYKTEESLWNFLQNDSYAKIVKTLNEIKNQYHEPNRKFDQFTATPQTTAKRASLLKFNADLQGKKILFLGDDDYTSIASCLIDNPLAAQVLDIDNRIIKNIQKFANLYKLDIKADHYDAAEELGEKYQNKFDVVFTDPPYTSEGFDLFLSRAIDALYLKNLGSRIYICFGNSDRAKERYLPIYDSLQKSGLMLRWVLDKFNRYEEAQSIGSASTLFICEVTPKTKSLVKGGFSSDIYTG